MDEKGLCAYDVWPPGLSATSELGCKLCMIIVHVVSKSSAILSISATRCVTLLLSGVLSRVISLIQNRPSGRK